MDQRLVLEYCEHVGRSVNEDLDVRAPVPVAPRIKGQAFLIAFVAVQNRGLRSRWDSHFTILSLSLRPTMKSH